MDADGIEIINGIARTHAQQCRCISRHAVSGKKRGGTVYLLIERRLAREEEVE